jgi:hypothetical protein
MVYNNRMKRLSFGFIGSLVLLSCNLIACGKEKASTSIDISGSTLDTYIEKEKE